VTAVSLILGAGSLHVRRGHVLDIALTRCDRGAAICVGVDTDDREPRVGIRDRGGKTDVAEAHDPDPSGAIPDPVDQSLPLAGQIHNGRNHTDSV